MDHLISLLLGALVGWTATLFLEHRQWLPTRGDLVVGLLGGLLGGWAVAPSGSVIAGLGQAADTDAKALAALAGAALAVGAWRIVRRLLARPEGATLMPRP